MKICIPLHSLNVKQQSFENSTNTNTHKQTHTDSCTHPNLLPHIYITLRLVVIVALSLHIAHHNKTHIFWMSQQQHNVFDYTNRPSTPLSHPMPQCTKGKEAKKTSFFLPSNWTCYYTMRTRHIIWEMNTHRMQTVNKKKVAARTQMTRRESA